MKRNKLNEVILMEEIIKLIETDTAEILPQLITKLKQLEKAIYAYDADLYDREREQRAEAGIVDFPGFGPEGPGGQDYFGMAEGGQEEGYIGNDELGEINGFDDDN